MSEHKCVICGNQCNYPWSICRECQQKAKQEKIAYLKYLGYEVDENA